MLLGQLPKALVLLFDGLEQILVLPFEGLDLLPDAGLQPLPLLVDGVRVVDLLGEVLDLAVHVVHRVVHALQLLLQDATLRSQAVVLVAEGLAVLLHTLAVLRQLGIFVPQVLDRAVPAHEQLQHLLFVAHVVVHEGEVGREPTDLLAQCLDQGARGPDHRAPLVGSRGASAAAGGRGPRTAARGQPAGLLQDLAQYVLPLVNVGLQKPVQGAKALDDGPGILQPRLQGGQLRRQALQPLLQQLLGPLHLQIGLLQLGGGGLLQQAVLLQQ
mmetsp:Transcript_27058/g.48781  ORF Transcript_27058/g.48781 Transcript_27058/m.48781 type:complete len:271 (-) Transcript_27058:1596-2408(-)